MEFFEKRILVTGAGSGLGKELTSRLLKLGARVLAADKRTASLDSLKREHPITLEIQQIDLLDNAQITRMFEHAAQAWGGLDVLINNAGVIQPFVKISKLEDVQIRQIFEINFFVPLTLIRSFLSQIENRSSSLVVNISSMGAYAPVPGQSIYGASKAALQLLTEGLEMELRETQTRVAIVFPGAMRTSIAENSGIKISSEMLKQSEKYKAMDAGKAADEIIRKLKLGKSRIFIGSDAKTMNILSRLSPKIAANSIYKQMKGLLNG